MMHVVRNDQLNSADLAFLPLFFAVSIIDLHYICPKGLAQRNEGQVVNRVGVDRVRYNQKRLLYFLTSVGGGVPREVVAPAGHAAHQHQNFRGR
jgi:hypothetical protein